MLYIVLISYLRTNLFEGSCKYVIKAENLLTFSPGYINNVIRRISEKLGSYKHHKTIHCECTRGIGNMIGQRENKFDDTNFKLNIFGTVRSPR